MMRSPKNQLIDSAVLVPIYRDNNCNVRLVFVRRNEGGIHGGQIAFPGGKHDPQDESMLATAVREANEEIGLSTDGLDVIADLPVIETHSTGYRIYPFLARIVPPPEWRRDKREIAEVFTVKLDDLARPEVQGDEVRYFPRLRTSLRIFFYLVGEYKIWGATYRMLQSLIPRLVAGEWEI
jgi:8-oxo-dGTP pyrophosphatase MutT (NUDIX family)